MKSKIKKSLSLIMIVALLAGMLGNTAPSTAYAEGTEQSASPETLQILIDYFGTTETFIQGYLDQGYNLNELSAAFYKVKESAVSFDEALLAIRPKEVNESASVTSEVYKDPIIELKAPMTSTEADQSGIMQRHETFTVTEEVYSEVGKKPGEVEPDAEEKPGPAPENQHEETPAKTDKDDPEESAGNPQSTDKSEDPKKTDEEQVEASEDPETTAVRSFSTFASVSDPGKHISEKAPVFSRKSFNEAPYKVGENGETISTLSGGLILEHADAALPGRGGMAFSLERQYNSSSSQFYDMDVGYNTYEYPIYQYFVTYNAVKRKQIPVYHVKYTENEWMEWDRNGDGISDDQTAIVEQKTIHKGTYKTEAEAKQVADQRIVYYTSPQSVLVQKMQYNNQNNFSSSLFYNANEFSGTLTRSGNAQVVSGEYRPAQTIAASQQTCTNSIEGKYDARGNWVQTGSDSPCSQTKTTMIQGHTVTLNRSSVINTKSCPSPNRASKNYQCTKKWVATYDGSVHIPASDTRSYSQLYTGTVTKPGAYSSRRFGDWVDMGKGYRERKAYNVNELPWVEIQITEGSPEAATLATDGGEWSAANEMRTFVNSNSGRFFRADNGYKYYFANKPVAEIKAYQAGSAKDITYYNRTLPTASEKRAPLGKGWSWKLPYIEKENGKSFAVVADGSRYEIVGTTLKGTDWEGTTVTPDTSVTVNEETSQQVITSADGLSKQYYTADGRLLLLSDSRQNDIQFYYEQNAAYQSKLLTQVKDAVGNTIQIEYTPSAVTIKQNDRTVTYQKKTQNGVELLDSVIDPLGRKTTYSYKLADAKFNLLGFSPERAVGNPYALLTSVQHQTGAKTFYEYENVPVKRYIGADSSNEAYRVWARKDQLTYENGTTEDYNRQTVSYTSDLGVSFGQKMTLGSTLRNGLTETQYTYRKEVLNADTPAAYYLDRTTVSAEGKTQTTSYTYGKTVNGRNYAAATPTTVTMTDNQTNDTFTTTSQYDDYGNVTSRTEPNGKTMAATYDATKHWLTSSTETVDQNNKQVSSLTYNAQGDVTQIVSRQNSSSGEMVNQADYTYDAFGNLLTQRLKNGTQDRTTTVQYDPMYQQAFPTQVSTAVTDADGNKSTITTSSAYQLATGDLSSSVDASGRSTLYGYDLLGRTIQVTQPDNSILLASYDDIGNRITVTDENGQKRVMKWNALGQQIETGYYQGDQYVVVLRVGYDPYGRPIWNEDALGNRTRLDYDAWSRVVSTTGADSSATTVKYNDAARTVTTTDPEGYAKVQTANRWGQIVQVQERASQESQLNVLQKKTYDSIGGNVLTETDGKGQTTSFLYDSQGQLTLVSEANGEQTRHHYDMLGNLVQTTDAAGNVKRNRFDEIGRRIQTTDKSGNATKSYYNPDGTPDRFVDRNGNTFTYKYDARGSLIAQVSPDETVRFTVDRIGKRTSMIDQNGTTTYAYNEATEQLKKIVYPDGLQTSFEYDVSGRRTSMTGPFGTKVYYGHDKMNRLTSVGTSPNVPDTQYSYKRNGLTHEVNSQNGVQTLPTYRGLDLVGLNQVRNQEKLTNYTYGYDENKNIVDRVQGDATDKFSYDQLDRVLTSTVSQEEYTYDRQGNRLTLSSKADLDVSASDYAYDAKNRLATVSKNGIQVSYKYNGDNLLVERAENGKTTRYYYDDGAQIIAEADVYNGTPTLKANYIRGAQLEAIQYADGSKAYVETNGHGDITELRNEQGVLLNQYKYDIWGNILSKEEKVHNPFRYSGELWDDTTGLQYLRARWYDPSTGRFINEDTFEGELTNPLSLNLYAYVVNNPLKYTDPTGHRHEEGSGWVGFPGNKYSASDPWKGWSGPVGSVINFLILDNVNTLRDKNSSALAQALAIAGLLPVGKVIQEGKLILTLSTKQGAIVSKEFKLTGDALKASKAACNCFTAGTKVQTDEEEKNIEDIEVGDKVLSKDENNPDGELAYKEVTALYRNQRDDIIKLHVGEQVIETTDNHPFWVEGKGWVFADELQMGDKLQKADGSNLTIDKVEFIKLDKPVTVYNFTVAEYHTYYVTNLDFWVHNTNCSWKSVVESKNATRKIDGLPKEQKEAFDKAVQGLASGNTSGLKVHRLLDGTWAADIKGIGKGRGQGRIIYTEKDGVITIVEVTIKHYRK
ncbi:polymorphic toxin-type HINT domain-containing protein [Saccharibacillus brassicae]|uniref:polymorphic toxin-type HINT domain-containing protein n=1 Tax=Saccharibacillus brassicae TaxID=2583377 RepID=UPI001479126F|nr:polymorphic toxin-type HINT domain-containing protein [Saccharibacillus brassicae]